MAKIERTKNASRNVIFGVLLKLYQIIIPFLMRTAMIYYLGVQYLGLNSLFASILKVLNLAELGVSSAMVYSMYKPIAEDDDSTVCALIKLYRTYYRIIGGVIAVSGLIITPLIPQLIKGELPKNINLYILYLLHLTATVLSYWLFSYKNSILYAHQRNDVISKVTLFTSTIQYFLQFIVLYFFHNYYYYLIIVLAVQIMNNIVVAYYSNKLFPQFQPKGNVDKIKVKEINQHMRDLFTSKVGSVIYDSADTIVVSAYLGLSILAVYQNYFYILSSITGFVSVLFGSCTAGIGNSIVTETKEKNYFDLNKFTFIICWIAGVCSACLLCLYQPFMELWVGKKLMLEFSAVIYYVIYFYIRQINSLLNLYKDAAGIWREDRFRPLVAALTNLALNLILVKHIGIYGILLSTVLAILFVGAPWILYNLFTVVFERKFLSAYLRKLLRYTCITFFACLATYLACINVNIALLPRLIIRGIICCFIPNIIFFVAYHTSSEYQQMLILMNIMSNKRYAKILKKFGMK